MDTIHLLAGLLAYVIAGRVVMRRLNGSLREVIFAGLNLAGVYFFLFYGHHSYYTIRFAVYLVLVGGQFSCSACLPGAAAGCRGWPFLRPSPR